MTAQVQQTADGGHCGRRWAPVNPVTNDGSCAQVLLSKDGGQSYSLAYIAQNEWSGSARLPGLLGELLPPKKTHNRATTAAAGMKAQAQQQSGKQHQSQLLQAVRRQQQAMEQTKHMLQRQHLACSHGDVPHSEDNLQQQATRGPLYPA